MHTKYLLFFFCLFMSKTSYAEEFKEKWHYINPEIADLKNNNKVCNEGFSKYAFSEIIQECKTTLKNKNASEPELPSGSNFNTYYREKRNPVTNDIEFIEQGIDIDLW